MTSAADAGNLIRIMLYVASFVIILLAIIGMAVGVLFGRPAIKGSCGGVVGECAHCTVKCRRRESSK